MKERIQKYLSRTGSGSRREIERWISKGRIKVDGRLATTGIKVDHTNQISIDGTPIFTTKSMKSSMRVIIYNKPAGEICSRDDPKGRPTVFARLPKIRNSRWISVGRLDFNTTGLILFVTNGELANRLMHPRHQIEREYSCRIRGQVSSEKIGQLSKGIVLDGRLCRFKRIRERGGENTNRWYDVVVVEGRYREVRRLWNSVNCVVSRLTRIRYGSIRLPRDLPRGESVELEKDQIRSLCQLVGMPVSLQ